MKKLVILLAMLGAGVSLQAQANADLAKSKACMACHSVDKKIVGPAFHDVAVKYAGEKGADAKLAAKIMKGGSGVWGTMAMPPNAVTEQEALTLAKWVLAQK
ncbi:MAG: c-type cytochrome [Massilia sp.]